MDVIGYQRFTADGAVGNSGSAVAIYSVHIDSGSGGAGSVQLRNGTAATDTEIHGYTGAAANAKETFTLAGGQGVVYPSGCFVDYGTNTDFVTVAYKMVKT